MKRDGFENCYQKYCYFCCFPYLHNREQIFYFIHIFKSLTNLQQASGVVRSAKDSNNHKLEITLGLGNQP